MTYGVNNQAFAIALADAAEEIGHKFYDRLAPNELCHYTREFASAKSIITSKSIWATALSAQHDKSEMRYGVELLQTALREALRGRTSGGFRAGITSRLPTQIEKARDRVFIACFCANSNSAFHWTTFGDFCFSMPFMPPQGARFTTPKAASSLWLRPVIYAPARQRQMLHEMIERVLGVIDRNCWGHPIGSRFDEWFYNSGAAAVSDVLLAFVSSFKQEEFEPEQEWRFVLCPKLSAFHSAPSMLTDAFSTEIETQPFPHVSLLARKLGLSRGFLENTVVTPWTRVIQRPRCTCDLRSELVRIIDECGFAIEVE